MAILLDAQQLTASFGARPLFEGVSFTVDAGGISATRVKVKALPQDIIRTYSSIRAMLEKADLTERARWTAQRIFHRLAGAEAKVRNKEIDLVTFLAARGNQANPLFQGGHAGNHGH